MADLKTNVKIVWYPDAKGYGKIESNYLKTNIAIPKALGGSGEGSDPKELLVSSAASCYIMTLVYSLQTQKLDVAGIFMDSEATNSKEDGFIIVHSLQVVLPAGATEKHIKAMNGAMTAADQACEVGNLLKKAGVQIKIEGKIATI
ncbi:peroxiredoxin, SACOL1771 subfamily [Paenibacillus algorifonticola]|uniref:Peroxiredoxin, SACOL1771 subfamily n=1 Tax=Paenibacillus algorifonticola TaxID=684063 RepID=A0A1I2ITW7_9BACL|nr:OsmC family protein [Paenibacillus algorifonticola]SFF45068.1 peroxiredoxin, SACOL1771 subfamily [Paenibacillus algorifonticola]